MGLRFGVLNNNKNTIRRKGNISEAQKSLEKKLMETERSLELYNSRVNKYLEKLNRYDINHSENDVQIDLRKEEIESVSKFLIDTKETMDRLGKTLALIEKNTNEKTEETGEKIINNVTEVVAEQMKHITNKMELQQSFVSNELKKIKKIIRRQILFFFLLFLIIGAALCVVTLFVLDFMGYVAF